MQAAPLIAYLLLAGRIIGLGLERPLVKRMGAGKDPVATTTLFVGLGCVLFALIMLAQALRDPQYFAGASAWLPLALIPGLLYAISFHVYVWALKVGEVSIITPLFSTGFVLMYIFDLLGGYASLAWQPIAGVLLVTLGVAFLTPDGHGDGSWREFLSAHNPLRIVRQPGAVGMLLCAAIVATNRVFERNLSHAEAQPLLLALVLNAPPVLAGIALLAWRGRLGEIGALWRERPLLSSLSALLGHGAYVLMLLALKYFPPSVIEPVSQLGVFIAVGLGGLWFHEPVRTRWLPSGMVVAGAVLLLMGR